jgi:hypothetical protein
MNTGRHPSRRRLQQWLAGEAPRRVNRHVDGCEHCEALLEDLSSLDDRLVADLHDAVTPPHDLADRTADGVGERLRDEAALAAFLDLFGIGWAATRAIVDPEAQLSSDDADDDDGDKT